MSMNSYQQMLQMGSLFNSDDDSVAGSSSSSPQSSSIGSPLDRTFLSANLYQNIAQTNGLAFNNRDLLDERVDSKYDFNRNGIEVPLSKTDRHLMNDGVIGNSFANTYKLFDAKGFDLLRASGKQYSNSHLNASIATLETKPTSTASTIDMTRNAPLYVKIKAKPRRLRTQMYCSFCKNNNETEEMYSSHILKDPMGLTMCPILRKYNCPICNNGGGDHAHTIRYCPKNTGDQRMPSVIKLLKNSRSSDGKRRNM